MSIFFQKHHLEMLSLLYAIYSKFLTLFHDLKNFRKNSGFFSKESYILVEKRHFEEVLLFDS